ncbi:hypothetical protein JW824_00260 [bacterium]|nr:hypothetical protein [bacterium]RQV99317.1 MAG: hypothetical protein EH221_00290 [bacterium]
MPITYQIKPDEKLVTLVHTGVVADSEFLSFYKNLYTVPQFDRSFNVLVNLQQAESTARSTSALHELAEFIQKQLKNINPHPKIAVVAPKDLSFGLARMYEVFSSTASSRFVVFRDADDALTWLGVSEKLKDDLAPP